MHRMVATLAFAALVATGCGAAAQGWPSWADDAFERGWGRERQRERAFDGPERARPQAELRQRVSGGDVRNGGPRPEIAPQAPPIVAFAADFPAHSIVIDSGGRKLYYVLPDHRAYRYAISVGREGFGWSGTETISRKQAWPDWYPPPEMRERDPRLPEKMTGGLKNPLGAMALYLGQTLYRIHGTNDVKSIGRAESSGCFRMLNSAVLPMIHGQHGSYLLPQAFPEGAPTHPCYPTGHGTVGGACITAIKFFFDASQRIRPLLLAAGSDVMVPTSDGMGLTPYTGADRDTLTINGELSKLAWNITVGHGIHAGIHFRSSSYYSILLGEQVGISVLKDRAGSYAEPFSINITKFDGTTVTVSNQ